MTDGFIRKKVESLTLGEKLVKLRSQYRMSLTEISKATRIQVKYLEALESGDHRGLPAEVYVRGFLRSYARYLGLEDDAFIKLYDKEKHIRTHLGKGEPLPKQSGIVLQNVWVITPRTATVTAIILILIGTFGYLFRELSLFVSEPHLVVMSPTPGLVTTEAKVVIMGKTDRGARVALNDEPVFVGNEGEFQEALSLQPGSNTLRVLATNRFEKTKEAVIVVEYAPPVEPSEVPLQAGETLPRLSVEVTVRGVVEAVLLVADDVVVWNGVWPEAKQLLVPVEKTLRIETSDPQDVFFQVGEGESRSINPAAQGPETVIYTRATLETFIK